MAGKLDITMYMARLVIAKVLGSQEVGIRSPASLSFNSDHLQGRRIRIPNQLQCYV